ncbi:MAG: CPBP family intramembrane metalloprotease [Labilithrix sp.]|nr:CPBP family intramembrane metalloprotease [Labilithrix sp.]
MGEKAEKSLSSAESRAAAKDAQRVAFWGLALFGGARLLGVVLDALPLPSAVAQAVAAEWGAGRLGVAWSDPKEKAPTSREMAKRAGLGAAVGLVATGMVVAFLASTRAIVLHRVTLAVEPFAVALLTAGLYAMRDELLLHGIAMRALVSLDVPWLKALACGVTSAAAASGEPAAAPRAVVVTGLLGIVFGALWVRDRGAWAAWGAHTAWLFGTGALMQGGAFDAHVAMNAWGGGNAGPLGGDAAIVALLPLAVGAIAGTLRAKR